MKPVVRMHCCLFNWLLMFQSDDLIAHYGDDMRDTFREEIDRARSQGASEVTGVWLDVLCETVVLSAPVWHACANVVFAATSLETLLTFGTALGFCSLRAIPRVMAYSKVATAFQNTEPQSLEGSLIGLPDGLTCFLSAPEQEARNRQSSS